MELLDRARRRLAFDEFLLIQLGVLRQRAQWRAQPGRSLTIDGRVLEEALASLPFELTGAQRRSLGEILDDMSSSYPMRRLLQGDVGSGKTVVALMAILLTAADGLQAALMAPTEILAEQHYATTTEFLGWLNGGEDTQERFRPSVRLLTGKVSPAERGEIYAEIASGGVQIAIGTHALIEEGVDFADLGLVIIDEQHRFGVAQRAALRQKGHYPDLLVMSATPIPRTLALTLYGDLDTSLIDELPPGRQEIVTRWQTPVERERAYQFLRSQVSQGRQAFIICPLVEESENIEAKAATTEHQRLQQEVFPDLRLGLLHGRMKPQEKEGVMEQFRQGQLDILVSTPVVEVGIDIPNATVMLVEGADRFGLAQLHQFRGRVGRGKHQSYCLLISEAPTLEGRKRLQAIEGTQDGFKLAEVDLEMRGPGESFGTRQSGLPDLKLGKLADVHLLQAAREEAGLMVAQDPKLESPEHRLLAAQVARFWRGTGDLS
jgi:ATP-dependent DNA helicase RecG